MLISKEELKKLWDSNSSVAKNCKEIATRYYINNSIMILLKSGKR